jgi:hypothetical protein
VTRRPALAALAAAVAAGAIGCSNITEQNGIAGLEIFLPNPPTVEVGQTIVLHARALDRSGNEVSAAITWISPDPAVSLTQDGMLTGLIGGATARVQAQTDAIVSDFQTINVAFRPDTLALPGAAALTVAPGEQSSAPLVAALFTLQGGTAQPLSGREIVYEVTSPVFADPSQRTVELAGGVLELTATTGGDGAPTPPVTLNRVAGATAPPTATVSVRAVTAAGATVPGSGQQFTITFQ